MMQFPEPETDPQALRAAIRQLEQRLAALEMEPSAPPPDEGQPVLSSDLSAHKRSEAILQRQNSILRAIGRNSQAILRAADEAAYLHEVCQIITEDCNHPRVWIGFAEQDKARSVRPVASSGFEPGYLETLQITWADTERGRGPTGTAIRTGMPSLCRDMRSDPAFMPWRDEAVKHGYTSSLALPLVQDGRAFGVIVIFSLEPDSFSPEEVELLSRLAGDLAVGISSLRTRAAHADIERALEISEARYRSLFNSLTEGFSLDEIICDEQGTPCDYRFLSMNPAFERLTGLKREEIEGRAASQVPALQGDDPQWVEIFGKVALSGEPVHLERYSPALKRYYEVFAYSPAYKQFAVLFVDVTDRKQAEGVLNRYQLLYENARDIILFIRQADGRIVEANRAAEQAYGYSRVELFDLRVTDLRADRDHGLISAQMSQANQSGIRFEAEHRRKDGSVFPVEVNSMGATIDGERVNMSIIRDITATKQAIAKQQELLEENRRSRLKLQEDLAELEKLELELRETNHRLKLTASVTGIGFWEWDPQGLLIPDEQCRRLLGMTNPGPQDLPAIINRIHEDDRERLNQESPLRLATHQEYETEFRIRWKDEQIRWVHVRGQGIYDEESGAPVRAVGVMMDVTERRLMEERTREGLARLEVQRRLIEQREQERTQIARDLHDGPVQDLTAAIFTLELLSTETQDEPLRTGLDNLQEMLQNQIAELRAYAGELRPPTLSKFGLEKAILSHAEQFQKKHPEIGLELDLHEAADLAPEPIRIALYRIYQESLVNVLKHSGATHIRVCFEQSLRRATLEISDNGRGFSVPRDWLELARSGHLGLVGMRERAEALGGFLEITTAPGRGATLRVTVPLP